MQANILRKRRILDDFFKVDEVEVSYERYDGSMTSPLRRLVFERGDSVAAVVYNRTARVVWMTEQFRLPTLDKGPGWLLELPAGMVEQGEQPAHTMRREIEEEVGFRADELRRIATFYVSPGGSSERIWLYYAEVSDAGRVSAGGGAPGEQEDVRATAVALERLAQALAQGELADAKTLVGVQWLLARESVPASAAGR